MDRRKFKHNRDGSSVRINLFPEEYAELVYKRVGHIPVNQIEAEAMLCRTLVEDVLRANKVDKTAVEIANIASHIQVNLSNACYFLEKMYEDEQLAEKSDD